MKKVLLIGVVSLLASLNAFAAGDVYQCKLSKYFVKNDKGLTQDCGNVSFSTDPKRPARDDDFNSGYFHDCDQISIRTSDFGGLNMGFSVDIAKLHKGSKESWKDRTAQKYASFTVVNAESLPKIFKVSLGDEERDLLGRKTDIDYSLYCEAR